MSVDLPALAARVLAADKGGVAQALNLVENRRDDAQASIALLLTLLEKAEHMRAAQRVGITGPPGVGKSTLVAALARELRTRGKTVGVVAVDPSSAVSGGALLGDRARMSFDPNDDGLFVRSLATGGAVGGLAHAAHAAVDVLSSAYDFAIVETTGVGQTETEVTQVADTVVLVVQPGSGDTLQFLKAGVMEIPDLLVVNKADHGATATRAATDLEVALGAVRQVGVDSKARAVLLTSARDHTGIAELVEAIAAHRADLGAEQLRARRAHGQRQWAFGVFERRYGSFGVDALGGEHNVRTALDAELRAGHAPPSAARRVGAGFEARLAR